MTTQEVMAINQAISRRVYRRRYIRTRMISFLQSTILILALLWCYQYRTEVAGIISRGLPNLYAAR